MKKYTEPTLEVIALQVVDVVTSSNPNEWAGWGEFDEDSENTN